MKTAALSATIDTAAAICLCASVFVVLVSFAAATMVTGRRTFARLEREAPLPIVGKTPMEAVYAAMTAVARPFVVARISANTITIASLVVAAIAAVAFALGHFGVGALVATAAALLDALDGLVARASKTASRFGQVLDTMVDRWVEGLFYGGIGISFRREPFVLALTFAALTGGFMVSYASSVLRELEVPDARAPMRRAERMTLLIVGAALVPFARLLFAGVDPQFASAPLVVALGLIAVRANVSACRRLLFGARVAAVAEALRGPASEPSTPDVAEEAAPAPPSHRLGHP